MEDPRLNPELLASALREYVSKRRLSGEAEPNDITRIAERLTQIARDNKMEQSCSMEQVQNWVSGRKVAMAWCYPVRVLLGLEKTAQSSDPVVERLDQIIRVLTLALSGMSHGVSDAVEKAQRAHANDYVKPPTKQPVK